MLTATATLALFAMPATGSGLGLQSFDVSYRNEDGSIATQAGSHPYALQIDFAANTREPSPGTVFPEETAKDFEIEQMPGFAGDLTAVPLCSSADFLTLSSTNSFVPKCADSSAVGVIYADVGVGEIGHGPLKSPVYELRPPLGSVAKFGFWVFGVPIVVSAGVSEAAPDNVLVHARDISQVLEFFGSKFTLWGNPASAAHDEERGACYAGSSSDEKADPKCPAGVSVKPLLTMPRACDGPLATNWELDSWEHPGVFTTGSTLTHDGAEPPNPQGMSGCGKLGFSPSISSQPTSTSAESGSGLDFNLDFNDEGLSSPTGIAQSEVKKAVVTLPPGMTINPSVGEGLAVCTPAQLKRETAFSAPGAGCPQASKVGTLHVSSPLVEEALDGSIFLAQQDDPATATPGAENPFDSLIALYFVIASPDLGVSVKEPVEVAPDPRTGQLVATLDDNVQLPFDRFNAHLRTGARAALVTPGACGAYTTTAQLTPWANPNQPLTTTASFQIDSGVGGGPCPPGGIPPFNPHFEAGAVNNNAGSFSPFDMRLIRADGEQDMTKFSATLPPGELGSLAGVSKCPGSAIALAKAKTGRQEIASPSCPANSLIGHTLAGAGVGGSLTYVKGYVYLGGPFHGDPLSVIAITPAVAGPFDAGTVVVQEALTLNPKTAEVEVDGANSDPIPHIVKGIVLKLRDLRVYVDRQNFTLNPTSCEESSARSVLFGSYLDPIGPADDRPVDLATRYQAANCLNLGFKPKLALNLEGGTKRGGHPGLTATYAPRKGDANIKGLVVRLPRSAFLDQAHIKTICTRVQFAAGAGNGAQCPAASRYGFIKAFTPLLDEPLEGPVFLRSSSHKLPDLVFALHGLVNIEVDVRIDSAHGGIRATLEDAPDATLSKVVLRMQGASKGLIVNSRNLCGGANRAEVLATGHNGKRSKSSPAMKAQCGKQRHKKQRRR